MPSVINTQNIVQYVATSGETKFTFPFKIFSPVSDEDINVYLSPPNETWDESGYKLDPEDYSISINTVGEGGSITLVTGATAGHILMIIRNIPPTRTTDFGEAGQLRGTSLDVQLDKLTILISQLKSKLEERGLLYPITEQITTGQTKLPKLLPNHYWKADGSGNLVSAECIEDTGCSTLRSELLSQIETAPGTDNIGIYDPEEKKGNTLTNYIEHLLPQKDSLPIVKNNTDETKRIIIDAKNISTGFTRKIIMADYDIDLSTISPSSQLPRGYIDGLLVTRVPSPETKLLTIEVGEATSSTNDVDIKVTSPITKNIELKWAEGSGASIGMLPSNLILTGDTLYYIAAISTPTGSKTDIGADTDINFANLMSDPDVIAAGYTKYRNIQTVFVDTALKIADFIQYGDWVYYKYQMHIFTQIGFVAGVIMPVQTLSPPNSMVKLAVYSSSPLGQVVQFAISNQNIFSPVPIYMHKGTTTPDNWEHIDFHCDNAAKITVQSVQSATITMVIYQLGFENRRGRL